MKKILNKIFSNYLSLSFAVHLIIYISIIVFFTISQHYVNFGYKYGKGLGGKRGSALTEFSFDKKKT